MKPHQIKSTFFFNLIAGTFKRSQLFLAVTFQFVTVFLYSKIKHFENN